jgi:hypothetical protein
MIEERFGEARCAPKWLGHGNLDDLHPRRARAVSPLLLRLALALITLVPRVSHLTPAVPQHCPNPLNP